MGCCVSKVKVKYQIGYMYQIFIKLDAPFVWMALVKYLCGCWCSLMLTVLQKDEDSTSSIWGEAPDKYGRWNCRCFVRFILEEMKY